MRKKKDTVAQLEFELRALGVELRGLFAAIEHNAAELKDLRFRYVGALGEFAATVAKLRQLGHKKKPVARKR